MPSKPPKIVPLATALAALVGATPVLSGAADAKAAGPPTDVSAATLAKTRGEAANRLVSVGEDLLSFIVTRAADGSVLAQHESHYSHSSHSSHTSHSSHYSSRY